MSEATPGHDLRVYWQHLRQPLLGPDGAELLTFLERRFAERLTLVEEQTIGGGFQRLARLSSYAVGDSATDAAYREGQRSVVLFLKDLRDMVE